MTTKRAIKCFILFISYTYHAFAQATVGDPCVVKHNRQSGSCKISSDCPTVQEQAQNGISPTICGFYDLTIPIVCCETELSLTPNENSFLNPEPNPEFLYPSDKENEPPGRPPPSYINSNNHHHNSNNNNNYENNNNNNQRVSKSERKCEEYSKAVTGVVQAIPLVPHTEAISINVAKCDYNGVALIVGGKPASAGEFPFMAAIGVYTQDGIDWKCGGTLVSENYVMTAAHCTFSRDGGAPEIIRLGDLDLSSDNDGSVYSDFNISKIIVHPRYRYPLKYNDIALIKLSRRAKFTKYIRPACLYTKREMENAQAIATGWGKTDFAAAEISQKLMKVPLKIYSNDVCQRSFEDRKRLPDGIVSSMLCAGDLSGGKDTCQGDSGGPLIVTKRGNQCKFYVIGITSFGKSCGQANTAAIYSKVSVFVPWIEENIW